MGGTLARAVGTGAAIVGAQWAVIASTTDPRAWGVALGLPALLAGSAVARLFAVTTVIHTGGHGGRGARR
jgi:fatty acid desaturase